MVIPVHVAKTLPRVSENIVYNEADDSYYSRRTGHKLNKAWVENAGRMKKGQSGNPNGRPKGSSKAPKAELWSC